MSNLFYLLRSALKILSAISTIFVFNLFNLSIAHAQDTPPVSGDASQWTGFYLGVGLGGAFTDLELDSETDGQERQRSRRCVQLRKGGVRCKRYSRSRPFRFSESSSFDDDETYFFGTIQLGYNQQINNMFVIGAFVDFDKYLGNSDAFSDININRRRRFNEVSGSVDLDYSATVGGRIGFLTNNQNTLVYGLVGYTYLKLDGDLTETVGRVNRQGDQRVRNSAGLPFPDELEGLTLGAGIETRLSRNVSFKFEYRYTDFDDDTAGGAYSSTVTSIRNQKRNRYTEVENILRGNSISGLDGDIHSIRAVLVYQLNPLP